ncbi:hypothetical protein EMCG_08052 [[Emmonsia] crescens]|uniref:Uncharacterized protein n=1 Tax=[Emmonsia] crescens TaxID=73230 RepID=A0A0G2JAS2_9EURO|nr:hypothetical protein EMCG_08052 [Emmonsia crescens UAMH 3008]
MQYAICYDSFANITQKFSGAGVLALLAASATALNVTDLGAEDVDATALDWSCSRSGGGGLSTLQRLHGHFNRKFGSPRLNIASQQCYLIDCEGHYFGVCNLAGYTKLEDSNQRNIVTRINPEGGSACSITANHQNGYLKYYFTRTNHISTSPKDDIRSCK